MRRNKIVALMESVFVKKNNKKLDLRDIISYINLNAELAEWFSQAFVMLRHKFDSCIRLGAIV